MSADAVSRRGFVTGTLAAVGARVAGAEVPTSREAEVGMKEPGAQRLSMEKLRAWETLGYGMFLHFGMSTFVGKELPDGKAPAATYAPDRMDVDQWISVARDAGMKYAVLTAKHVAGHCLWPSTHTACSVAHSGDTTDVCAKFVEACTKRGVQPGFYYCSWDNHHRFGSRTPSDPGSTWGPWRPDFVKLQRELQSDKGKTGDAPMPCYTTSHYQSFQTAQVTELLTRYGPIVEMWIDIPGVLGPGYRRFLYEEIARLQPETVIMMNSGIDTREDYESKGLDYAWPSDLIAIERRLPPESGHRKWRTIDGRRYYLPGEVCDPIGKEWFFVPGDEARPDVELAVQFEAVRARGANFLLDVPPDTHGVIPEPYVRALMRLRRNAGI